MTVSFSSILATATDPLFLAGVVIVTGFFGARFWQRRSSLTRFFVPILFFFILTPLVLGGGVVPYRPGVTMGSESRRFFLGALRVIWGLGGAWVATAFF